MAFRNLALAALCFGLCATSAVAQSGGPGLFKGTPEEQAACRRDAARFCRDAMPDDLRVLACLQANRAKISKACNAVLVSHGQ
jgi:hypothetical protein